ncbi:MAG: UDP-N-acetylmuramoyl-L-alanyl-D-glutamate--2,6-diaminopimelate ligase [Candidatus Omnitrophica bacterium]|nr:UDP-N-acetylmuramoyl-L-alanyl-D-glutamate--2,6-diaminopimelate ligase [Candidatus Omnitrophota bacterium]
MLFEEALKGIDYSIQTGSPDIDITALSDDSRTVTRGSIFVALEGYAKDGRNFVNEAVSNGAVAIISDPGLRVPEGVIKVSVSDVRTALAKIAKNFYGDPSAKLKVIGITGTNGKTTTTYLIEAIAKSAGAKAGVIGTINYRSNGDARPAKNTTPGSLELQKLLSEMVDDGVKYAAVEVSSHALDQGRVSGVGLDVGLFTNITSDHLDYHKTKAEYFKAKSKIFAHLKNSGVAVLNYDDEKVRSIKGSIKARVLTYGINEGSDVKALKIKLSSNSSSFEVSTPSGEFPIKTRLIGMHNVSNCLAAIAAMYALGVDRKSIAEGIGSIVSIPGRLESVEMGQSFKVLVDYAHTEDALNNVLSILKSICEGKVWTVFGCGGDRDKSKRPLMGLSACKFSDRVIVTSDNPRSEEPLDIIRDIKSGINGKFSNYDIVPDRREAIRKAVSSATKGDIILIAGKGHEDYQIIKDGVIHFDDREVAAEILAKKMKDKDEGKRDSKGDPRSSIIGRSR